MIKNWSELNPEDICGSCGHKRSEHSELEESLGNDSHDCEKQFRDYRRGKATYTCNCERFEDA